MRWDAWKFRCDAFGSHFDASELGDARNESQGVDAELAVGERDPRPRAEKSVAEETLGEKQPGMEYLQASLTSEERSTTFLVRVIGPGLVARPNWTTKVMGLAEQTRGA
jgi:hypothetical protein